MTDRGPIIPSGSEAMYDRFHFAPAFRPGQLGDLFFRFPFAFFGPPDPFGETGYGRGLEEALEGYGDTEFFAEPDGRPGG